MGFEPMWARDLSLEPLGCSAERSSVARLPNPPAALGSTRIVPHGWHIGPLAASLDSRMPQSVSRERNRARRGLPRLGAGADRCPCRNTRNFLAVLANAAGNSMANAISTANTPPNRAEPRFWRVNPNLTPPMVKTWRAPPAEAWFAAMPDRTRLGTTTPARNRAIVTPPRSCRTERALWIFPIFIVVPPFVGWTVEWW